MEGPSGFGSKLWNQLEFKSEKRENGDTATNTIFHPTESKGTKDAITQCSWGELFNSLTYNIRNHLGTKETFKTKLDTFLSSIPDNPVIPGLIPAPICRITCRNSNSIIDWVRHLNLSDRRPNIDGNDDISY